MSRRTSAVRADVVAPPIAAVSAAALQLAAPENLTPMPAWAAALAGDPIHGWVAREWRRAAATPGAWYDERSADVVVDFFRTKLRHTKGRWAGKPFVLLGWEEAIVRMTFGWHRADRTRLFRRVIVWVARKNGKTELAAGIMLAMLLLDGEWGGEVYSIAKDKKQASIVFKAARTMVNFSDELKKQPPEGDGLDVFSTSIFCSALEARIEPLSGEAEGKHGLNCSGLVGDEAHEWDNGDLYTFVHQSEGTREQPLEFIISTAGQARRGYGWELWEECRRIIEGIFSDAETLVVDYAVPEKINGVEPDWRLPATWRWANPSMEALGLDKYLAPECERAKQTPDRENDFRRYHLNQWTGQAKRWLPMIAWRKCSSGEDAWKKFPKLCRGRKCFSAIDLAAVEDISARVDLFPPDDKFKRWIAIPTFWVPQATVELRSKRRVPYENWAKWGALIATPGNTMDFGFIKQNTIEAATRYLMQRLAIDRLFNAHQIMQDFLDEGLPVVGYGQGFLSMTLPSKEILSLVLDGDLDHGGHPVLAWMADNVAIRKDAAGCIKPDKETSSDKIDGMVALIMAKGVGSQAVAPAPDIDAFLANPVIIRAS
jgi:phage terminase large subunit-like protein